VGQGGAVTKGRRRDAGTKNQPAAGVGPEETARIRERYEAGELEVGEALVWLASTISEREKGSKGHSGRRGR
jgi:hypothetical protein